MTRNRESIRLKKYDYSKEGVYFLTLCVQNRECLFGRITHGKMCLNDFGQIVSEEWINSREIRPNIQLDEFVVMPNHFHGIIIIHESERAHGCAPLQTNQNNDAVFLCHHSVGARGCAPVKHSRAPKIHASLFRSQRSLGSFVAGFKSICTKRINVLRNMPRIPLWQRNYYEHIIRNEEDLNGIRRYIADNPSRWNEDENNIYKEDRI